MKKILLKCKTLQEMEIPQAIVVKLERKEAYDTNHREKIHYDKRSSTNKHNLNHLNLWNHEKDYKYLVRGNLDNNIINLFYFTSNIQFRGEYLIQK